MWYTNIYIYLVWIRSEMEKRSVRTFDQYSNIIVYQKYLVTSIKVGCATHIITRLNTKYPQGGDEIGRIVYVLSDRQIDKNTDRRMSGHHVSCFCLGQWICPSIKPMSTICFNLGWFDFFYFYDLSAWCGCWFVVYIRRFIYKFLNVCPFDCTAVAGSGKVGP